MAVQQAVQKQVKIKAGVVKRLHKEWLSYGKELERQQGRIQKMKDQQEDEYNIKKQMEVLQETQQMIPDCQRRFQMAYKELFDLVQQVETDAELAKTEEYQQAKETLDTIDVTAVTAV